MSEAPNYKIGDVIWADHGQYGRIDLRQHTIKNITPTGQISCEDGSRFNKQGRLLGTMDRHYVYILSPNQVDRLLPQMKLRQAWAHFNAMADQLTRMARGNQIEPTRLQLQVVQKAFDELAALTQENP